MPSYKLKYFNARGRAEVIRMVFAVAGVAYEDNRMVGTAWSKDKQDTLCKQVPELEVDGVKLTECRAIYRYIAREYGLFGEDNLEAAKIGSVCSVIEDLFEEIIKVTLERDADTKEKLRKRFQTEVCGNFAEKLENILEYYNANGDFFVGKKMTLADIVFLYVFHDCLHRACGCGQAECLTGHPNLKKIYQNCLKNERLNTWLEKRPVTEH